MAIMGLTCPSWADGITSTSPQTLPLLMVADRLSFFPQPARTANACMISQRHQGNGGVTAHHDKLAHDNRPSIRVDSIRSHLSSSVTLKHQHEQITRHQGNGGVTAHHDKLEHDNWPSIREDSRELSSPCVIQSLP